MKTLRSEISDMWNERDTLNGNLNAIAKYVESREAAERERVKKVIRESYTANSEAIIVALYPPTSTAPQPPAEPTPVTGQASVSDAIRTECNAVGTMLCAKNAAYGNSALDPLRCFSKANAVEQLKVRIDDKISRLARGHAEVMDTEDTELDLIGYLVLLRVARRMVAKE